MKIKPQLYKKDKDSIHIDWENEFEKSTMRQILQKYTYGRADGSHNPVVGNMYGNALVLIPIFDEKIAEKIYELMAKDRELHNKFLEREDEN